MLLAAQQTCTANAGPVSRLPSGHLMVELSETVAGVSKVEEWVLLARTQPAIDEQELKNAKAGDYFALEDRNFIAMPWRRVYVVCNGDEFVIFDQQGQLIAETNDDGKADNGRHPIGEVVNEFSQEGFWYRPPKWRPSPDERRSQKSARSSVEQRTPRNAERSHPVSVNLTDRINAAAPVDVEPIAAAHTSDVDATHLEALQAPALPAPSSTVEVCNPSALCISLVPYSADDGDSSDDGLSGESSSSSSSDENDVDPEGGEREDSVCNDSGAHAEDEQAERVSNSISSSVGAGLEDASLKARIKEIGGWVGERVSMSIDGKEHIGMLAEVNAFSLMLAVDDGTWLHFPAREAAHRLSKCLTAAPRTGVVGLVHDRPRQVAGMLCGGPRHPEVVMGGQAPAFAAFVAREAERGQPHDLRTHDGIHINPTFMLGDIVSQINLPENVVEAGAQQAAVVRVVYKARKGNSQARKLLILREMLSNSQIDTPTHPPELFPASWTNWRKVSTLSAAQISELETVLSCA